MGPRVCLATRKNMRLGIKLERTTSNKNKNLKYPIITKSKLKFNHLYNIVTTYSNQIKHNTYKLGYFLFFKLNNFIYYLIVKTCY